MSNKYENYTTKLKISVVNSIENLNCIYNMFSCYW